MITREQVQQLIREGDSTEAVADQVVEWLAGARQEGAVEALNDAADVIASSTDRLTLRVLATEWKEGRK